MKPKRGRACADKVRHVSREAAVAHRRHLIEKGAFAANLRVYRCRFAPADAPHWHIGHPTGSAQSK